VAESTENKPPRAAQAVTEGARRVLLDIAAREFATHGYGGARLERIAQEAGITRAMIYYYFKGREGLYVAVLEDAYNAIWKAEQEIATAGLSPMAALRQLVEFRVFYYVRHPTFVALVGIENQEEARHLRRSVTVASSAAPSLDQTARILSEGKASGAFRPDIDVVDLYQVIVSLAFFNVSNRHTFGEIFGRKNDFDAAHVCAFVTDVVLRYVSRDPCRTEQGP
jgi:TetR/AcrR family transcriptional regulator